MVGTLNSFVTVSLEELSRVSLLHRVDSKYLLPGAKVEPFLKSLNFKYRVLTIADNTLFSYRTLYYDTDRYRFFHEHHNGKAGRYKVRSREYVTGGLYFDEVKLKTNKGKTFKYRQKRGTFSQTLDPDFTSFVARFLPSEVDSLVPRITVYYDRVTFVDTAFSERMTVDTNVRFEFNGTITHLGDVGIVELKQDRGNLSSPARLHLRDMRIKQTGCSKYCVGLVMSGAPVKANRFKRKIRQIIRAREGI